MRYLIVAEAYRDLERVSSRLALTERLAALLAETPAALLPTVCYLCQGLIAPEFAGVDLGLAEKLAVRALAAVAGTDAAQVAALVREAGDLGQAAEQLLAPPGRRRPAAASGPGGRRGGAARCARSPSPRGRLAGPQAGAAGRAAGPGHPAGGPLPAAPGDQEPAAGHRHAHHLGRARPGVRGRQGRPAGARARLQHLLRPRQGGRHPGERRAGRGGAAAGAAGEPGAGHAGPAAVRRRPDPGPAGRAVRGRVQVRRHPGPGAPHRRREGRAVHPAA